MNEEANFCSQCGAKVSPGAKFCSNCGYDLQNSSAQTPLDKAIKTQTPLDKTIKIEVTNTNATVEKGFEAIGKVFKRKKKKGWRMGRTFRYCRGWFVTRRRMAQEPTDQSTK